jgi:hypothetical protein
MVACVAVALGVEAAARIALDRSSKIQRRMVQEYQAALAIGGDRQPAGHLLVLGNSLLDEGIEFDRLQRALAPWEARRFVVENTYYYDWYYGLRRLYRAGARPDVVVLVLSVGQWMPAASRGDYSAQYLFSTRDLPEIVRDLKMHPTQATDLFVANMSKFWGARAEMRNFVLGHLMPDLGRLMAAVQPVNRGRLVEEDVEQTTLPRIERLRDLAHAHGSEVVLLIPPMLNPDDGSAGLIAAAGRVGVSVLLPVPSGTFAANMYRDGFHLNPAGAARFTARLIDPLRRELTNGTEDKSASARMARK